MKPRELSRNRVKNIRKVHESKALWISMKEQDNVLRISLGSNIVPKKKKNDSVGSLMSLRSYAFETSTL